MFLKLHISGDAIVYDSKPQKKKLFPSAVGRPQGSLFNQQKRKIADACEYLRLFVQAPRIPVVFTLTTPSASNDIADSPLFVSRWFENMRSNYSMGEYVWVREYTKKGMPHFHCVADWHNVDWFFESNGSNTRIQDLSESWSSYFGSNANNSIWLGGYWYGKRIYQLKSKAQCRYLCKYLGKGFTVRRLSFPDGTLQFQRITSAKDLSLSLKSSLEKRNQENLNRRQSRRKKQSG